MRPGELVRHRQRPVWVGGVRHTWPSGWLLARVHNWYRAPSQRHAGLLKQLHATVPLLASPPQLQPACRHGPTSSCCKPWNVHARASYFSAVGSDKLQSNGDALVLNSVAGVKNKCFPHEHRKQYKCHRRLNTQEASLHAQEPGGRTFTVFQAATAAAAAGAEADG